MAAVVAGGIVAAVFAGSIVAAVFAGGIVAAWLLVVLWLLL